MTPLEGRNLLKGGILLLALSAVRLSVVSVTSHDPVPVEGESDLERLQEESLRAKADMERRTAPLAVGEKLDPNRSPEEELDRLISKAKAFGFDPDRIERIDQTPHL